MKHVKFSMNTSDGNCQHVRYQDRNIKSSPRTFLISTLEKFSTTTRAISDITGISYKWNKTNLHWFYFICNMDSSHVWASTIQAISYFMKNKIESVEKSKINSNGYNEMNYGQSQRVAETCYVEHLTNKWK